MLCGKSAVLHRAGKCPIKPKVPDDFQDHLDRFSEKRLITLAKKMLRGLIPWGTGRTSVKVARIVASACELWEREQCAKLAEAMGRQDVADEIRKRGTLPKPGDL